MAVSGVGSLAFGRLFDRFGISVLYPSHGAFRSLRTAGVFGRLLACTCRRYPLGTWDGST